MTDRQLLQQALDALETADEVGFWELQKTVVSALNERLSQPNDFSPDWGAMAVMVEEQQRMAKRIEELEAQLRIGTSNSDVNPYAILQNAKIIEAQPEQEPVAWTLLLVGEHNGSVGKAGEKFVGHPEHYERVDVYKSPPQRKPLTEPEQEPWAALLVGHDSDGSYVSLAVMAHADTLPLGEYMLYTTPPAPRPWVGLTDEEIENAISDGFARGLDDGNVSNRAVIHYVRVIEAKLKDKNHD